MAVAISFVTTTSCISINTEGLGYSISDDYDTTTFVSREFVYTGFNAIEYHGYARITFKQGDSYSIVARSTEEMFEKTKVSISDNKLIIDQREIRLFKAPIFLTVTAPDLNNLDLGGNVNFYGGDIKTSNCFDIELSGAGTIDFSTISCNEFKADVSGATKINGKINAESSTKIECSGASKADLDIVAPTLYTDCSGAVKLNLNFTGANATIENSGASSTYLGFTGDKLNLDCSGASKVEATVRCKELNASGSGASKFEISGVAEVTHFDTSGATSLNTKNLNNY